MESKGLFPIFKSRFCQVELGSGWRRLQLGSGVAMCRRRWPGSEEVTVL